MSVCKLYVAANRECFEFDDRDFHRRNEKKDFPFTESLLKLLELDYGRLEELCGHMDRLLLRIYEDPHGEEALYLKSNLDTLAREHVFFEITRRVWEDRLREAERQGYENIRDRLPHKELSHIPAEIAVLQRQIAEIFRLLDVDGEKKPVWDKLAEYCARRGAFEFRPLETSFELVRPGCFVEVVYPRDYQDAVNFLLRECLRREQRMKTCRNCGKYFAILGRASAEYCDRPYGDKGRTCKDVGSDRKWKKNKAGDDVFKDYRREYKKRFAWIKAGRITQEEFYAWSERARAKKTECDKGELTREEFQTWLEHS